jgi:hypothetical protein
MPGWLEQDEQKEIKTIRTLTRKSNSNQKEKIK